QSEIDDFRSLLSEVANSGDDGKPAVIILDELDRCRPTYALAALEKVKHFFSVEGLVFVFVLNTEQMCASVEQFYGSGIDARQYLHKFIDVECRLPSKELKSRGPSSYKTYSRFLLSEHKFNAFGDMADLDEIVPSLAQAFDLSLRDMEKACRNIVLFYASIQERQLHISSVVALIAVIKVKDRVSYDEIAAGVLKSYEPVVEKLKGDANLDYIRNWFLTCLGHDSEVDESKKSFIEHAQQMEGNVHLKRTVFLQYHCAILDYFSL
ncbi:MAG: KAP family NTPase, partial [Gammaproteobacteria bacterium]|nr:KAP family NTPase [Gammaproteobacteria bacterium]